MAYKLTKALVKDRHEKSTKLIRFGNIAHLQSGSVGLEIGINMPWPDLHALADVHVGATCHPLH
jgi:hypothetical protein